MHLSICILNSELKFEGVAALRTQCRCFSKSIPQYYIFNCIFLHCFSPCDCFYFSSYTASVVPASTYSFSNFTASTCTAFTVTASIFLLSLILLALLAKFILSSSNYIHLDFLGCSLSFLFINQIDHLIKYI